MPETTFHVLRRLQMVTIDWDLERYKLYEEEQKRRNRSKSRANRAKFSPDFSKLVP